ncbi:MAG: glycosyltransferase family 2 protein [Planctomycetales bacterium]
MFLALQILIWTSLALVAYAYILFPAILWAWSKTAAPRDSGSANTLTESDWPFVSLVVAAYKEEKDIVQRLHNALAQDYPADRFEIIIGCDGNEDRTGELVQSFTDPRVRLLQYPQRRGKASVLNDSVPQARGEIIIFSDANTEMDPQAFRQLVRPFVDSSVGGVCGNLILQDSLTGQNVDGAYWKYENFLKRHEAKIGALLGVNGGIYAIRKSLYQPIPSNTIIDDFLIGMRIHLQGYQLLYEPRAIAYEETPETMAAEFHRRVRIGAGGFQSLVWLKSLLHPSYGSLAFCFLSHKLLRWLCPFFMLAAFVGNLFLINHDWYARLLLLQSLFYLTATAGLWLFKTVPAPKWMRLPAMFVSMNTALFFGFFRWLKGIQQGTWKRTERSTMQGAAR